MKRWADYLEQDGFVYIICLLAANDMFGLCVSKKGEGGGGAEGAVLACNPPSPPPHSASPFTFRVKIKFVSEIIFPLHFMKDKSNGLEFIFFSRNSVDRNFKLHA